MPQGAPRRTKREHLSDISFNTMILHYLILYVVNDMMSTAPMRKQGNKPSRIKPLSLHWQLINRLKHHITMTHTLTM